MGTEMGCDMGCEERGCFSIRILVNQPITGSGRRELAIAQNSQCSRANVRYGRATCYGDENGCEEPRDCLPVCILISQSGIGLRSAKFRSWRMHRPVHRSLCDMSNGSSPPCKILATGSKFTVPSNDEDGAGRCRKGRDW